jgi:hypothetical protein
VIAGHAKGDTVSQHNVQIVKSVQPPSGTNLSSLLSQDAGASGRLQRLASLLTSDFDAVGLGE